MNAAAPEPEGGPLGGFLLHPDRVLSELAVMAGRLGADQVCVVAAVLVAMAVAATALVRLRGRRLTKGARQITVLPPPTVDPDGAAALWSHLTGLLRPRWQRVLFGQPHIGFEYLMTAETGATIRLWVPDVIPPGLVERAVEAKWPGARTHTDDCADPPLPQSADGRRLLVGGELRLGRGDGLPIRTDHTGVDLVRDLIWAASDLPPGCAARVQVLARPVTGARVRRAAHHTAGGLGWGRSLLSEVLDLLTPGALGGRRGTPGVSQRHSQQAGMEHTAQSRAAAVKTHGAHYETVIRYAVSAPADTDPASVAHARAVARGRAHALAAVFTGGSQSHNYYRRRRNPRLATALEHRRLGRGDLLSVPELAGIARLPLDATLPGLRRAGARTVAPVADIALGGPNTKPLGHADSGHGRPVALRVADARHHTHALGATGVGKSNLLGQLVLDDADAGRGVVVVDPKGDLITDVLDRLPRRLADRVVLFDADSKTRPPSLNPLDAAPADIDLAVDNLVTIFHRIYSQHWGPRTDDVLRVSLLTLCAQPGVATLADLPRLLGEPAFRERVTRNVSDPILRGFWTSYRDLTEAGRAQIVGPLLNKLRGFLLRPFVRAAIAAGPSTVDLPSVLNDGGICLARLPKGSLGEDTARLVGSLVVARTWQAATARARSASRPDATLYLDEAQNFLNLSTPVEDILAEARGLRLSLVLAHQNLAQLTPELREAISTNARNKIVFTASPQDARELARHTAPWLSEHDLTHLDAFHAAARLLVKGQQTPPFTFTTQPLPPPIPGRAREIRAALRARDNTAPAPGTPPAAPPSPGDPRRP